MRRPRYFFCSEPSLVEDQLVQLDLEESHHLRNVLRIKEGASCFLCNGEGTLAEARVQKVSEKQKVEVLVQKVLRDGKDKASGIHLFFAIPSKGKIDYLIEKAQEMGVRAVYPLETKRTVLKISKKSQEKVIARWQRIAREAAKQSRSLYLLDIHAPVKLEVALENQLPGSETVVLHPSEDAVSFRDCVLNLKRDKIVNLFIGPEGGFEDEEVETILSKKATKVGLGENILKTDTAMIGATLAIKLCMEEKK